MPNVRGGAAFHLDLFLVFFRIGLFTLGGGYAMVPLIEREVVEKKGWLGGSEFIDALAVAQSLPGPIAVNTSVFVGYKTAGLKGSLTGLLGTALPSFICMLVIAAFFSGIKDNPAVISIFAGIRPAVAALIAASVWSLGRKAGIGWLNAAIALPVALAVWLGGLSPAWVVLILAAAGIWFPAARKDGKGAGNA
ncbi:MAG: chromate transporter [Planctomycetota bacterium]|nr:chromate transporter [Planctomycetota bacterium]